MAKRMENWSFDRRGPAQRGGTAANGDTDMLMTKENRAIITEQVEHYVRNGWTPHGIVFELGPRPGMTPEEEEAWESYVIRDYETEATRYLDAVLEGVRIGVQWQLEKCSAPGRQTEMGG